MGRGGNISSRMKWWPIMIIDHTGIYTSTASGSMCFCWKEVTVSVDYSLFSDLWFLTGAVNTLTFPSQFRKKFISVAFSDSWRVESSRHNGPWFIRLLLHEETKELADSCFIWAVCLNLHSEWPALFFFEKKYRGWDKRLISVLPIRDNQLNANW